VQNRAVVAACLIIVGSLVVGLAAGLVWAAVAPRVVYQVQTLNPPTAYATNPETSAFIAADGWYCLLAVAGGALIGLLGYQFGVRRYGPLPMAGIVIGAIAAAFGCAWLGHRQSGGPGFDHLLATSRPGTLLHAPISLGSQGAMAFWPLAAAAVAGGIELIGVLRARNQQVPGGMPISSPDSFGGQSSGQPDRAQAGPPYANPGGPDGQTAGSDRQVGPGFTAGSPQPGDEHRGQPGGHDPFGGDPGRAAL
jgi:hypothetical protein